MATGDQSDFSARLLAVLPARWFPDTAPVLDGLLAGLANAWAYLYALLQFVVLQARIATATGVFLDMISADFFGTSLPRGAMNDASFRAAILPRILRQNGTRQGMAAGMLALTGSAPAIIEPFRPSDCGALGGGPVLIGYAGGGTGYSTTQTSAGAGRWGTRRAAQVFIAAGASTPSAADIYATADVIAPAGVETWVQIPGVTGPPLPVGVWDVTGWDTSTWA